MLYKYAFVKHRKLRELNFHFLYFIRKIKGIKKNTPFTPIIYFHQSFLNQSGQIAPKGTFNKEIHSKFNLFFNDFKKLKEDSKDEFHNLVVFSNDIHLYFEDNSINEVKSLTIENIKKILKSDSFKNLMDSLWKYLKSTAWEIDKHYEEFYNELPNSKMCPFCGLNEISNQTLFKSDYDHIANKAKYPISSINLKNLAPSCSDCNQKFKNDKDVFYKDNIRRVFLYPYLFNSKFQNQHIEIDLTGSIIPNTDSNNINGKWLVNIHPSNNFNQTWNEIYSVKKRYCSSLYVKHDKWLQEFTHSLKIANINFANQVELIKYLSSYKEMFNPNDNLHTEYHLKYSYFKYLEISFNDVLFNQINMMCA